MECLNCATEIPVKQETINYRFKECGLDNVFLIGVISHHCDVCGETSYDFGDLIQLHKIIADFVVRKDGLISGAEMRFLRKHLGYSGPMFGKLIGVTKDHIYKMESGEVTITDTMDHFIRHIVAFKSPDRNYNLHDLIINEMGSYYKEIRLEKTSHGWDQAQQAL